MAAANPSTFGVVLKRRRLAAGLTQEALAERAGVSARGVQDLERGVHATPRSDTVRLLADALELDAAARAELIAAAHPELGPVASPKLASPPIPLTSLIGRELEVAEACTLLRPNGDGSTRLLTMTGPGGVGKTRLAIAVATALSRDFADGVAWADMAPIRDPGLVAATLARALGVREEGTEPLTETIVTHLAHRRLLLVIDNAEHVLAAIGVIAPLLASAPGLAVLVTSRTRLRLRGEREMAVPPLEVPTHGLNASLSLERIAGVAAARLFVERAGDVRPGFALTSETATIVAEICRRLDGLPLAIELAAARVKVLPPTALLERLEPRLPLLTGGPRDGPPHQQTMEAAIAWSYDLLCEAEQELFRRLAVFAGGFTFEAVDALVSRLPVSGANGNEGWKVEDGGSVRSSFHAPWSVFDGIAALLDHSLLKSIEQPSGEARFMMLETIREFGLERLDASGEAEAVRRAHADYFLDFATHANGQLLGLGQAQWLDRLEAEHENLRSAFDCAMMRPDSGAVPLRLAAELWRFWWLRGYLSEGRARAEAALARGDGSIEERARALHAAGDLAQEQGDYDRAVPLLEAARSAACEAGRPRLVALCLTGLAIIATNRAAYWLAAAYHEEALTAYQEAGDPHGIAVALGNLGEVEACLGNESRANALCAEAESLYRTLGDRYGLATTLTSRGKVALVRGNFQRAHQYFEQSLAIYQDLAAPIAAAIDTVDLGRALQGLDDPERAGQLFDKALATFREHGHRPGIAWALACRGLTALDMGDTGLALSTLGESLGLADNPEQIAASLEGIARASCERGLPERAARLLGAAAALRDARDVPVPVIEAEARAKTDARIHSALDESIVAAAWTAGRDLSLEEAIAEAMAIVDEFA